MPLNSHMSRNVLTRYPKKCLLEAKQTLAHVCDLPKKPPIGHKTKPLSSQKVGPKNGQHGVPWHELVVPFGIGKC